MRTGCPRAQLPCQAEWTTAGLLLAMELHEMHRVTGMGKPEG